MDFLELARARYSVRKFSDKPIEPETLEKILEAGRVAPTACNRQPQRVLVISDAPGLEKLRHCTGSHFGATAALLVCYDRRACWTREYDGRTSGEVDASIVTTHMMLEAASLGVGSTWVMHFDPALMRAEFAVPEALDMVALLVMGYPAPDAKPYPGHAQSLPASELVKYGAF